MSRRAKVIKGASPSEVPSYQKKPLEVERTLGKVGPTWCHVAATSATVQQNRCHVGRRVSRRVSDANGTVHSRLDAWQEEADSASKRRWHDGKFAELFRPFGNLSEARLPFCPRSF